MTNEQRIEKLAQSIYTTRNNRKNDVEGSDLTDFLNITIEWVNQFIPEIEKKADWNFVRTNNNVIGTVTDINAISYQLPAGIRKLVVSPYRSLTITQDDTPVSSFKVVEPNLLGDRGDIYDLRRRVSTLNRKMVFSGKFEDYEQGGKIVADTISSIPELSMADVSLLDMFDEHPDIRQLFVLGAVKNQILPDIVQGGLTPSYSQKFDAYLADCIAENNASADAADADRESFSWVGGVGM